jgi:uncharacterized protein (DUF2342 family)
VKINNYPEIMKPAFRLVEKHAPNTYEAMQNAFWPVTAAKDVNDLRPIAEGMRPAEFNGMLNVLRTANAITAESSVPSSRHVAHRIPAVVNHSSIFNLPNTLNDANAHGVDPTKFLATVAVHEWTHRRGYDEPEAYAAGARFAEKMGDLDIARWHAAQGRRHTQEQELTFAEMLRRQFGLAA